MNEFVPLAGLLEPIRNSLILIGLVLRTFSAIDADCPSPQVAVAMMSPLNGAGPDVTFSVALTLAPGATGPAIVFGPSVVQPAGTETLSDTSVTGAPVVFVYVTTVSWVVPGANVCRPGGPGAAADATATVPLRPLPDESSTLSPLASSNL